MLRLLLCTIITLFVANPSNAANLGSPQKAMVTPASIEKLAIDLRWADDCNLSETNDRLAGVTKQIPSSLNFRQLKVWDQARE